MQTNLERQKADLWMPEDPGAGMVRRDYKKVQGYLGVSQVYSYVKIYQIVYFKYLQFIVC